MNKIKIESDGTLAGTKVMTESGEVIGNVSKIEFEPIDANSKNLTTTVKLTCIHVPIKMFGSYKKEEQFIYEKEIEEMLDKGMTEKQILERFGW